MVMSQRMWRREQERKRRERERRARRRRNCTIVVILIAVAAGAAVCLRYCSAGTQQGSGSEATQPAVSAVPIPSGTPVPVSELDTSFYEDSVFVGNSLADGISLYGLLPQTDFYARVGIDLDNAYTTASVNSSTSIVDQLKSSKFDKVFLCFGESELASEDPQEFYDKYSEMVSKVKEYQQSARIYLVAIPPVTEEVSDASSNGMTIDNIKEYNDVIKELAFDEDIYFADAYEALAYRDGFLSDGISADGINLNRDCYIEMLNYIADNFYIPDSDDLNADSTEIPSNSEDSSDDSDRGSEETSSPRPTRNNEDSNSEDSEGSEGSSDRSSPKPTVNVLKDTATSEKPQRTEESE